MKKNLLFILFALAFFACTQQNSDVKQLQAQVADLQRQLDNAYKPGFGEFMGNIQIHHAKLWFAGQNKNWQLADFEIHEIMESVDAIQRYETDRPESKQIGMIRPALDSVNAAIQQANLIQFDNSFVLLTNTCNNCHHAVQYDFNEVKIPDSPPFSNQNFKMSENK